MDQKINSPDITKVYACVFRPVKVQCASSISIFHLLAHGKFINLR